MWQLKGTDAGVIENAHLILNKRVQVVLNPDIQCLDEMSFVAPQTQRGVCAPLLNLPKLSKKITLAAFQVRTCK